MHITLEGWLLEVGINDGNAIGVLLGDDVLLGDSEGLTSNTFVLQFPQDLELKTKCIGIIRMVSLRHLHLDKLLLQNMYIPCIFDFGTTKTFSTIV